MEKMELQSRLHIKDILVQSKKYWDGIRLIKENHTLLIIIESPKHH